MGRARGSAAAPREATGPDRRGRLSVVHSGVAPPRWVPTTLDRLTGALDLRAAGPREFEAAAAEPEWPSFPGAQLLASAVVAAERSFPGYSVGHMSCSFGPPPRADHPVGISLSEVHSGASCITGRMTFRQRGAPCGEVAVVLRSGTAEAPGDPSPGCGRAVPPPEAAAAAGGERRPPLPIVPWELLGVPRPAEPLAVRPAGARLGAARLGPARRDTARQDTARQDSGRRDAARPVAGPAPGAAGCCPVSCSWTWSRATGTPSDGTLQRALLAYLSELLPIACAAAVPYPSAGGARMSATVLSHAITYGARVDLRDWLLAAVEGPAAGEGYVHALATFRTQRGELAATVSQAAAVWDQERPWGLAGGGQPARHLMLSG
jgi:acyl-CoA thioesterase